MVLIYSGDIRKSPYISHAVLVLITEGRQVVFWPMLHTRDRDPLIGRL